MRSGTAHYSRQHVFFDNAGFRNEKPGCYGKGRNPATQFASQKMERKTYKRQMEQINTVKTKALSPSEKSTQTLSLSHLVGRIVECKLDDFLNRKTKKPAKGAFVTGCLVLAKSGGLRTAKRFILSNGGIFFIDK